MILKNIKIVNFRCFKRYEIDFASGATVMFGKNGVGKTSLIHALHKALSFIMYSDNVYETVNKKGKKKKVVVDVKTITNNNPYLHPKSFAKGDFNNSKDKFIEVIATADFDSNFKDEYWKMSVLANNCKLRPSEFKEAFHDFYQWHTASDKLPLLAYFSDSYPHLKDSKRSKVVSKIRTLRNFGYFDWDEEEGCIDEWIDRLETNLKQQAQIISQGVIFDNNRNSIKAEVLVEDQKDFLILRKESEAIEVCLKSFTDDEAFVGNENIQVAALTLGKLFGNVGKLCVHTADGMEIPFRKLPAGYMRLFNIVLDLAYRSYILSKGVTTDISGIVIIDEIDLHLHPALEKVALSRLRVTFPSLQFIVSTHSPLVLVGVDTNDKTNSILRMTNVNSNPEDVDDIYGLDYNSSLQDIMGVESSDAELNSLISSALYIQENGTQEQYDSLYSFMLTKLNDNRVLLDKLISRAKDNL